MDLQQQAVQTQEQFASTEMRSETSTPATTALACNIGNLLSFSCRTRAESFARKLQLKLTTLGSNGADEQTLLLDPSSVVPPYSWTSPADKSPSKVTPAIETASQLQHCMYHNNNNELPVQVAQMNGESPSQGRGSDSNCTSATVGNSTADSDFYFDFDIGSPGSPTESCYSVINPCDDLFCKDCTCPAQNCQHCSKKQVNGTASDHGFESGCVFSSPASTSPDAYQNETDFGTPMDLSAFAFPESEESPKEELRNGIDIGDCSSDASDSTYYDVESSFSSSSSCSSPKVSEDFLKEHRPEESSTVVPEVNEIKHYERCKPYETVDELLSGLRIISLSNDEHSSQANATSATATGDETKNEHATNSGRTEPEQKESERPKSPLRLNVQTASLSVFHDKSLLSPSSDDDDERPIRIQRSSSLKTGKTPPGTPGRKKIVRFADVLGLDLAAVRTFLDEIPNVPKSAFKDLDGALEQFNSTSNAALTQRPSTGFNKTVVPSFHQPVSMPDYFDRIRDQKVLLENAFLGDHFTIKGTVRVMNMDFHKSVYIRYSYDEWRTFTEIQAIYVNGSCDGFSDKFEFSMALSPQSIEIGGRLTFACRFHCQGQQFWDNNAGRNYVFHCVPASTQTQQNLFDLHAMNPSMEDSWINHMWM